MGHGGYLSNFKYGMVVGARRVVLSMSETSGLYILLIKNTSWVRLAVSSSFVEKMPCCKAGLYG